MPPDELDELVKDDLPHTVAIKSTATKCGVVDLRLSPCSHEMQSPEAIDVFYSIYVKE